MTLSRHLIQGLTGRRWLLRLLGAGWLACGAGGAAAVAVSGTDGTADQGRRTVIAAPANGVDAPVLTLVAARIDAVDLKAGTLTLKGLAVPLHPSALRILGSGGQSLGGPANLRAGMNVRVGLEPEAAVSAAAATPVPAASRGAPPLRRIVLIYVDY